VNPGATFPTRRVPICFKLLLMSLVMALSQAAAAPAQTTPRVELLREYVEKPGDQRYAEIDTAIQRFRDGFADEARQLLEKVRQANPALPPTEVLLARLARASGNVAAARTLYERVIAASEDPEAYIRLGDMTFQDRRLAAADLLFTRGLERIGESDKSLRAVNLRIRGLAGKAAVAESRGQWRQAETSLKAWLAADPKSAEGHARLARVLFELGQLRESYDLFHKARELSPALPRAEINMALLLTAAAQKREAQAAGESDATASEYRQKAKALIASVLANAAASDLATRLAAAQWALEAGELDLAKQAAQAAARLAPESAAALKLVGMAARYEKRYDDARKAFEAAHLLDPTDFAAINQLALVLVEHQQPAVQRLAQRYAQLNSRVHADAAEPAGREATATLAWVAFRNGNAAEAERTALALLRSGASISPESTYFAVKILVARGRADLKKALQTTLRRALAGAANFPTRGAAEKLLAQLEQ